MKNRFQIFLFLLLLLITAPSIVQAYPEYSAYNAANCMACHVGPMGGFGRRPTSPQDPGYITDKFSMSGDLRFMALYDQREPDKDRMVLFPMEAALHATLVPTERITIAASMDYGTLREAYGMIHHPNQTYYARAGLFTLPYGLLFPDHTAFIKEGRIEAGNRSFSEVGIGKGLFGIRYKDSGVEVGYSGKPWFVNFAVTGGVVEQEERSLPNNQGGTKRAITRRAGFITKHISLGASMYTNDNEVINRRILRYGGFGWLRKGPFVLQFEHDEGEDEPFTVSGSTQISASYVELVYATHISEMKKRAYAKVRYERLDPNRSLDNDVLQRWVFNFTVHTSDYIAIESYYRVNLEQPTSVNNDDVYVIAHFHLN